MRPKLLKKPRVMMYWSNFTGQYTFMGSHCHRRYSKLRLGKMEKANVTWPRSINLFRNGFVTFSHLQVSEETLVNVLELGKLKPCTQTLDQDERH
jgi:hypothetical protein